MDLRYVRGYLFLELDPRSIKSPTCSYSFGILLWELYTAQVAFSGVSQADLMHQVGGILYRWPGKEGASEMWGNKSCGSITQRNSLGG